MGLWSAGLIAGGVCIALSLLAIFFTKETYGKDLDYNE
jgi:hypothetical protein